MGTTTTTPNISLQVPDTDSPDWQTALDYDLNQIDLFLSGNLPLPGLYCTGPTTIPLFTTYLPATIYTVKAEAKSF